MKLLVTLSLLVSLVGFSKDVQKKKSEVKAQKKVEATATAATSKSDEVELTAEEEALLETADLPQEEVSTKASGVAKENADEILNAGTSSTTVQQKEKLPLTIRIDVENIMAITETQKDDAATEAAQSENNQQAVGYKLTQNYYPAVGFKYPKGSFTVTQPYTYSNEELADGSANITRQNMTLNASYSLGELAGIKLSAAQRLYLPTSAASKKSNTYGTSRTYLGMSKDLRKWTVSLGNYFYQPLAKVSQREDGTFNYKYRTLHEVVFDYHFNDKWEAGLYYSMDHKYGKNAVIDSDTATIAKQHTLSSSLDPVFAQYTMPGGAAYVMGYPELTVDHINPNTSANWAGWLVVGVGI